MSPSKLIAILTTPVFLFAFCFGQRATIDSLQSLLPTLNDSAKVDCLNKISEAYIGLPDWFGPTPGLPQMDTAETFAIKALKEAKKIDYIHGIAKAISLRADLAFEKDNNYVGAEKLCLEAIDLYKKSSNKKGLNRVYWRLGASLHTQSIFDSAVHCYDNSYMLSLKSGDSLFIFYSVITAANVLIEAGEYERSLERTKVLHQLITVNSDVLFKWWELIILGSYYFDLEDYNTSLKYQKQASNLLGPDNASLATTFALNRQFDSARKYFIQVVPDTIDNRSLRFYLSFVGEYYLALDEYDKALPNLLRSFHYNQKQNDVNQSMLTLIAISKSQLGLQNYDSALKYAVEVLSMGNKAGARQIIMKAYKVLSLIYDYKQRPDSAYNYFKKYTEINESVRNDKLKGKLSGLAFEQKIEMLNKEKEIQQIQLQKQHFQRNILIAGIFVFIFIAFLLWRNNRHKQEANSLLRQQKEIVESTLSQLKSTQTQLIQSEKMASLGELTAGIAHEIQNPLNFVNNFSEVNSELIEEMQQELDKGNYADAKEISNDIKDNEKKIILHGKRADSIVKGMLQHSRISSGVKEPTNINALADEYLRLAYQGLRAKDKSLSAGLAGFNATLKTDFDPAIGNINIIPQDIGRVLLNLINNAFYALSAKASAFANATADKVARADINYEPTLFLSTRKLEDKIEIIVTDNGNGIPEQVLDKVFQPFFTTKPTGQGTGLGLSLSYDIVKAHQGTINIRNTPGAGAEFIITLPINA